MNGWKNFVRTCRVAYFRFTQDLCFLRACALTYQSLLAIVPVIAVMFGIAKGFGFEQNLDAILRDEFHEQQEAISHIIQFGHSLLEQARGGIIAGIGIVVLFFTVVRLFSNIESALNAMWGIPQGRTWTRKASDYLALIVICPILIIVSSSVTLFIRTSLQHYTPDMPIIFHLVPFVVSTLLFTLVYIVMPNITVHFTSALCAGIFTGCAYQILQASYISIQIQVSNAGAIYGSFAAFPLFLMWLYLSWLLFLIGAEILVIHQERLWKSDLVASWRKLSPHEVKLLNIACLKVAVDAFLQGKPIHLEAMADALQMPERLVTERIEELCGKKLLLKITNENRRKILVVPAQNPEILRLFDVAKTLDGKNELLTPSLITLDQFFIEGDMLLSSSNKNPKLQEIREDS